MFTLDWAVNCVTTSLTMVEFDQYGSAKDEVTDLGILENHVGLVLQMFRKRFVVPPVLASAADNTMPMFHSPDNSLPLTPAPIPSPSTSDTSTAPAELPLTLSVEQWSVVLHNCKQNHQGQNRTQQRLRFHHPFTGQLLKRKNKQHFTGADAAILCQQLAQHAVPPEYTTRIRNLLNQHSQLRPRSRSPRPAGCWVRRQWHKAPHDASYDWALLTQRRHRRQRYGLFTLVRDSVDPYDFATENKPSWFLPHCQVIWFSSVIFSCTHWHANTRIQTL